MVDLLNEYTDNTRKGRVRGRVIDLGIKQEAHDAHTIQKNVKVFSKQETLVIRISALRSDTEFDSSGTPAELWGMWHEVLAQGFV